MKFTSPFVCRERGNTELIYIAEDDLKGSRNVHIIIRFRDGGNKM